MRISHADYLVMVSEYRIEMYHADFNLVRYWSSVIDQ